VFENQIVKFNMPFIIIINILLCGFLLLIMIEKITIVRHIQKKITNLFRKQHLYKKHQLYTMYMYTLYSRLLKKSCGIFIDFSIVNEMPTS